MISQGKVKDKRKMMITIIIIIHSQGGGIWCLNKEVWNQNANHAWRTTGSNPVLTARGNNLKQPQMLNLVDQSWFMQVRTGLMMLRLTNGERPVHSQEKLASEEQLQM